MPLSSRSSSKSYTGVVRRLFPLLLLLAGTALVAPAQQSMSPQQAQGLVARALSAEIRSAQDNAHPMRYRLAKTSPRLSTVKLIAETRDGDVARLIEENHHPLTPEAEAREEARLNQLLANPAQQNHRRQREEGDMGIVLKLLRLLPHAFTYQYIGSGAGPTGKIEKFSFRPNPGFRPPDLESQALTSMSGEVWVDEANERVTRLEGHLQTDTSYGLGILGKLDKGGWILLEQSEFGPHNFRISHFQIKMNLRILYKEKVFDTLEDLSAYTPLPPGIDYKQAIGILRSVR